MTQLPKPGGAMKRPVGAPSAERPEADAADVLKARIALRMMSYGSATGIGSAADDSTEFWINGAARVGGFG